MRVASVAVTLAAAASALPHTRTEATDAVMAPNILVILTDDQGWGDTPYQCDNSTNRCAHMPNMQALASSPHTATFHRFYAAAGVCRCVKNRTLCMILASLVSPTLHFVYTVPRAPPSSRAAPTSETASTMHWAATTRTQRPRVRKARTVPSRGASSRLQKRPKRVRWATMPPSTWENGTWVTCGTSSCPT
jgi:hypothetical protein